jgi:pentatricopeptide repeat protein
MKKQNINPNLVTFSTLLNYFGKQGMEKEFYFMWEEMLKSHFIPDDVCYAAKFHLAISLNLPGKI